MHLNGEKPYAEFCFSNKQVKMLAAMPHPTPTPPEGYLLHDQHDCSNKALPECTIPWHDSAWFDLSTRYAQVACFTDAPLCSVYLKMLGTLTTILVLMIAPT